MPLVNFQGLERVVFDNCVGFIIAQWGEALLSDSVPHTTIVDFDVVRLEINVNLILRILILILINIKFLYS